jgi:hypothetical protein
MKPDDWVPVQFGHNDAANSANYPDRTTLSGHKDETAEIDSPVTHAKEAIHSYGGTCDSMWPMRRPRERFVIIASPPPRNSWLEGKVISGLDGYAAWSAERHGSVARGSST